MIVFLDLDGVLVHLQYNPSKRKLIKDFDPECVEILNYLVNYHDAEIVISSCWRRHYPFDDLCNMLELAGVGEVIIDTTGTEDNDLTRGQRILKWLSECDRSEDYLVIDDESAGIIDHIPEEKFIHVSDGWMTNGLRYEHIKPHVRQEWLCPQCQGNLKKKPDTAQGIKHCERCGAGWHILQTSDG